MGRWWACVWYHVEPITLTLALMALFVYMVIVATD